MSLADCTGACGWGAAALSVLSFGSFGVPLRGGDGAGGRAKAEMHPLVMQSYKTLVCFGTCWVMLPLGAELRWSHWGIVSGLFWVPGATCGVYGIQNAGLAVAVGTWSAIIVLTSFLFGVLVFREPVRHLSGAAGAFGCLMAGLIGMSRYPATPGELDGGSAGAYRAVAARDEDEGVPPAPSPSPPTTPVLVPPRLAAAARSNVKRVSSAVTPTDVGGAGDASATATSPFVRSAAASSAMAALEVEPAYLRGDESGEADHLEDEEAWIMGDGGLRWDGGAGKRRDLVLLCGGRLAMTRRQLGVLGAAVNGAWGGLSLVPMHYARRYDHVYGAEYLVSFAGGALLVNTSLWGLLLALELHRRRGRWREALEALPRFHCRALWRRGLLAGLLYSVGNGSAILAVAALGQSVGYPVCQMQLLVSGAWGIFYFREVRGAATIARWFLSAAVALLGIVWLAYEREGGSGGGHR